MRPNFQIYRDQLKIFTSNKSSQTLSPNLARLNFKDDGGSSTFLDRTRTWYPLSVGRTFHLWFIVVTLDILTTPFPCSWVAWLYGSVACGGPGKLAAPIFLEALSVPPLDRSLASSLGSEGEASYGGL